MHPKKFKLFFNKNGPGKLKKNLNFNLSGVLRRAFRPEKNNTWK